MEKQWLQGQLSSPCALESTRESTRKIVTVLFLSDALSGKDTLALFFTSGRNEMGWKFTEGVRTDGGILPCTPGRTDARLGLPCVRACADARSPWWAGRRGPQSP